MNAIQSSSVFQREYTPSGPSTSTPTAEVYTIGKDPKRLCVSAPCSTWYKSLEKRIEELVTLPRNWDGYNGIAIPFSTAQFAVNLLESLSRGDVPPPSLVPGGDGSIQIEWHTEKLDIEIDILRPYEVYASRYDISRDKDTEIKITADFAPLVPWIAELQA